MEYLFNKKYYPSRFINNNYDTSIMNYKSILGSSIKKATYIDHIYDDIPPIKYKYMYYSHDIVLRDVWIMITQVWRQEEA